MCKAEKTQRNNDFVNHDSMAPGIKKVKKKADRNSRFCDFLTESFVWE